MRVRHTPRVFADRERILACLDRRSPRAAREAFIKRRIIGPGENPGRTRLINELGVHARGLGRYPYTIYRRVVGGAVRIVHIRHPARRPWEDE